MHPKYQFYVVYCYTGHNIRSIWNIGTLFRTGDAFGVDYGLFNRLHRSAAAKKYRNGTSAKNISPSYTSIR